jgi:hypothetical protein
MLAVPDDTAARFFAISGRSDNLMVHAPIHDLTGISHDRRQSKIDTTITSVSTSATIPALTRHSIANTPLRHHRRWLVMLIFGGWAKTSVRRTFAA